MYIIVYKKTFNIPSVGTGICISMKYNISKHAYMCK